MSSCKQLINDSSVIWFLLFKNGLLFCYALHFNSLNIYLQ